MPKPQSFAAEGGVVGKNLPKAKIKTPMADFPNLSMPKPQSFAAEGGVVGKNLP
jgi:hypothetical protein